jgi:hypothetical protein
LLDPDPDPGGREISCFDRSAECYVLRAEGFSCSLGVLYGGLGISKLQFLIKNNQFFVIKTLDPDPESLQMLDPDAQYWFIRGGSFPTIRLSLPRLRCDILVSSMRSSSSRPVSPSRW